MIHLCEEVTTDQTLNTALIKKWKQFIAIVEFQKAKETNSAVTAEKCFLDTRTIVSPVGEENCPAKMLF